MNQIGDAKQNPEDVKETTSSTSKALFTCAFIFLLALVLTLKSVHLTGFHHIGTDERYDDNVSGMLKSNSLTSVFAASEFNKLYPNSKVVLKASHFYIKSPTCEFDDSYQMDTPYSLYIKVVDSWFKQNVFMSRWFGEEVFLSKETVESLSPADISNKFNELLDSAKEACDKQASVRTKLGIN